MRRVEIVWPEDTPRARRQCPQKPQCLTDQGGRPGPRIVLLVHLRTGANTGCVITSINYLGSRREGVTVSRTILALSWLLPLCLADSDFRVGREQLEEGEARPSCSLKLEPHWSYQTRPGDLMQPFAVWAYGDTVRAVVQWSEPIAAGAKRAGSFGAVLIRAGQIVDSIVLYPAVAEQDFDIVSVEWPRSAQWPSASILVHNGNAARAQLLPLSSRRPPVEISDYVRFPYPGHAPVRGPSRRSLKVGFGLSSSVDVPFLAVKAESAPDLETLGSLRIPAKYGTGLVFGAETLLGVLAGFRGSDLGSDAVEFHSVRRSGNEWLPVRSFTFAVRPQGVLGTPLLTALSDDLTLIWVEQVEDGRVAVRLRSSADSGLRWTEEQGVTFEGRVGETQLDSPLPDAQVVVHPWIAGRGSRRVSMHRHGRGWAAVDDPPPFDGFRLRALSYPIDGGDLGIVDEIVKDDDGQTSLRLEGRRVRTDCR